MYLSKTTFTHLVRPTKQDHKTKVSFKQRWCLKAPSSYVIFGTEIKSALFFRCDFTDEPFLYNLQKKAAWLLRHPRSWHKGPKNIYTTNDCGEIMTLEHHKTLSSTVLRFRRTALMPLWRGPGQISTMFRLTEHAPSDPLLWSRLHQSIRWEVALPCKDFASRTSPFAVRAPAIRRIWPRGPRIHITAHFSSFFRTPESICTYSVYGD